VDTKSLCGGHQGFVWWTPRVCVVDTEGLCCGHCGVMAPLKHWSLAVVLHRFPSLPPSQNHRMVGVGRDLWGSSGPTQKHRSRRCCEHSSTPDTYWQIFCLLVLGIPKAQALAGHGRGSARGGGSAWCRWGQRGQTRPSRGLRFGACGF